MAVIKGKDLMIFVNGKSIAFATSHSYEMQASTFETTSALQTKDGNAAVWSEKMINGKSWTASSENVMANTAAGHSFDDLFALYTACQPVTLVLGGHTGTSTDVPEGGWTPASSGCLTGQALITSLSVNAGVTDNATFSISFEGTGELKPVTQQS